jgi:hypothetical protein
VRVDLAQVMCPWSDMLTDGRSAAWQVTLEEAPVENLCSRSCIVTWD